VNRQDTTEPAADGPIDELDLANLLRIGEAFAATDPMPADLPERIRFALALRHLRAEVARIVAEEELPALATRGEEQSRTITFDSESLTIMIRIDPNSDGTVRVDGWLAPAQRREIQVKTAGAVLAGAADEQGRFAFARVPRGQAQIVVLPSAGDPDSPGTPDRAARPGEPAGSGRSVVTPALVL
jgi:hypothetical protein